MIRTRIFGAAPLAALALVALAACGASDPSPSPTPEGEESPAAAEGATPTPTPSARPALSDLALGPDGFAELPLGAPASSDPALSLVSFDPAACSGSGLWSADPSYAATDPNVYGAGTAFTVTDASTDGPTGEITRIDLNASDIPTTEGVRFGDGRASVEAAYPGVSVIDNDLTDIYVVPGTDGNQLLIEVASDASYWAGFRPDETVVYIHAATADWGVFSVAASENLLGICLG
jgi:hypothetical protein